MDRIAIFIDGGHVGKLWKEHFGIRGGYAAIDYQKLVRWISGSSEVLRAHYYDCLPYQSAEPSQRERDMLSGKQRFFFALEKIPRFCVRQGKLVFRGYVCKKRKPSFIQKRVDLRLGLDLGSIVTTGKVEKVALIAGDSDFIPAIEFAREKGVITLLVHGPFGTYHKDLWQAADDRKEITQKVVRRITIKTRKPP